MLSPRFPRFCYNYTHGTHPDFFMFELFLYQLSCIALLLHILGVPFTFLFKKFGLFASRKTIRNVGDNGTIKAECSNPCQ